MPCDIKALEMKFIEDEGKEEKEGIMNEDEEDCQFVARRKEEVEPLNLHECTAPA